jgi:hypothetical protein
MTKNIVLVVFFVFISFVVVAYFTANWLINRSLELHERTTHQDLEACQLLFSGETQNDYNTFPSTSHEASRQDIENRRTQRRERMRDHVSGVYQIAVSRLDDEVSVSSDDSECACGVEASNQRQSQVDRGEEEEDPSESESGSSDGSDSGDDAIEEMRGLLSIARPLLQRVASLRADVTRVMD